MYAGLRLLQGLNEVEHGSHAEITGTYILPTVVTVFLRLPRPTSQGILCVGGQASPNVKQAAEGTTAAVASNPRHFRPEQTHR